MDHLRPANRPLKLAIGAPQELEWSAVHKKVAALEHITGARAARSLAASTLGGENDRWYFNLILGW
jgi:hypothetical protein